MNGHINELADEINLLSLGTSAFVEGYVNKKHTTFIVIKDKLQKILYSTDRIEMLCKCAFITNRNIMSSHLMLKIVCGEEIRGYYPFHFNYFNENSLRIVVNLMHQKNLYVILCSENDECIELVYYNVIRKFFKSYIKRVLKLNYEWDNDMYEEALNDLVNRYGTLEDLWDDFGSAIELTQIE